MPSSLSSRDDRGVFISDIVIGGTAFRDGRLRRGDRLLAIDDQDVVNASKDQVAPMLRVRYIIMFMSNKQAERVKYFIMIE